MQVWTSTLCYLHNLWFPGSRDEGGKGFNWKSDRELLRGDVIFYILILAVFT